MSDVKLRASGSYLILAGSRMRKMRLATFAPAGSEIDRKAGKPARAHGDGKCSDPGKTA